MDIVIGDLLTLEGKKYITLDSIEYNGKNYIFTNMVTNEEEPTENFLVYKIVDGGLVNILDKDLLNALLPKFSKNVQKMVDNIF